MYNLKHTVLSLWRLVAGLSQQRAGSVCGIYRGQIGIKTSFHSGTPALSCRHHFVKIFHFHITEGLYILLAIDNVVK